MRESFLLAVFKTHINIKVMYYKLYTKQAQISRRSIYILNLNVYLFMTLKTLAMKLFKNTSALKKTI